MFSHIIPLALICAAATFAQVPVQVAKISNLDTSLGAPRLEYQNTGSKALTAVVIVNLTPQHRGEVIMEERPSAPIAPGGTGKLAAWSGLDAGNLASQVEIAAVIFSDGTRLGSAPNPAYNNVDAIDQIFELRRATATALAKWAAIVNALPSNDRAALEEFAAADPGKPAAEFHSETEIGAADIQGGMHQTALRIKQALALGTDPHTLRIRYLSHIPEQAAATAKQAQAVTQ